MQIFAALLATVLAMVSGELIGCTVKGNCTCVSLPHNKFQINCPDIEQPSVSIFASRGFIRVTCTNTTDHVSFPKLNVGKAKTVEVQNCYVPDSFEENVLQALNLTDVENFTFDMCMMDSSDCHSEKLVVTNEYMRGLNSVRQLKMTNSIIGTIKDDAFKHMMRLEIIELSGNNLTILNKIFDYAPHVKLIDLSNNQITQLASGIFDKTPNLRMLFLYGNQIDHLDEGLFWHTNHINVVELSSNRLKTLSKNLLGHLINLTQVSFLGNNLSELPKDLLQHNHLLTHLRLANNNIKVLPRGLFANLTELKSLDLRGNFLETLPELTNLKSHLEELDLERNEISSFDVGNFDSLQILRLGFNKLCAIDRALPWRSLQELYLEHNNISYVVYHAFFNLEKLLVLNLASNKLSVLEEFAGITAFNYLVVMEELCLSNNSLRDFHDDFLISTKIRKLDLSYNLISSFSLTDLMTTSEDVTVNIEHNQIDSVDFGYWTTISESLEVDGSVIYVQLAGNPLTCDCHSYDLSSYFHKKLSPNLLSRFKLKVDSLKCAEASPAALRGRDFALVEPKELTCIVEKCAVGCSCKRRPWDDSFIVDCSGRNLTGAPVLPPDAPEVKHVALHLEDNFLTDFPGSGYGYGVVTELYLQNNKLFNVSWLPPEITILDLQGNNLKVLGKEVLSMLSNSTTLSSLSLQNNLWSCDCSDATLYFVATLRENLIKKIPVNNLTCSGSHLSLLHVTNEDLCGTNTKTTIVLIACAFATLALLLLAMVLYHKYNHEIKVWLFAHNLLLWFITEEDLDKDKTYDAFLSYSHKDEDFVMNHLLPELEAGPNPYKLCIHERDWIAGEFITTQIIQSVQNSRRTIMVLTPNFVQSVWFRMEFKTAHTEAMMEGRVRLIIILFGDVDLSDDLDEELRAYLKTNTYLKWGDPWFWDKLRYALPHRRKVNKN